MAITICFANIVHSTDYNRFTHHLLTCHLKTVDSVGASYSSFLLLLTGERAKQKSPGFMLRSEWAMLDGLCLCGLSLA